MCLGLIRLSCRLTAVEVQGPVDDGGLLGKSKANVHRRSRSGVEIGKVLLLCRGCSECEWKGGATAACVEYIRLNYRDENEAAEGPNRRPYRVKSTVRRTLHDDGFRRRKCKRVCEMGNDRAR